MELVLHNSAMFLYHEDLMFPERHSFHGTKPAMFKKFKNIRASIDCTAFKCEVPCDYGKQGNIYAAYKHQTTMKCLIAVNPNAITYTCIFRNTWEFCL